METNHENINNHCNNRTTAHISHKHVHSTLQTTLIQMMLFVWVTPQRCGRKVDRTLCLCIYGKECRIDRTLYSTLLIFLVWSTGPLLIIFGRPDGKLFLSPLPIIPCCDQTQHGHRHRGGLRDWWLVSRARFRELSLGGNS